MIQNEDFQEEIGNNHIATHAKKGFQSDAALKCHIYDTLSGHSHLNVMVVGNSL